MKKFITSLFTFFIFCSFLSAQKSNAEMGVGSIGLVVSDIEKSEAFYTEVVGMIPVWEFSLDEKWAEEAGASNGRPFSVKMFAMNNERSATTLKLAYFDKMDKKLEQSGIDLQSGVNYITFNLTAEGFSALMTRLDQAGVEKLGWVKRENYQLFFVRDPDGVFVEFVGPPDN